MGKFVIALVAALALASSSFGASIKVSPALIRTFEQKGEANIVISFDGVTSTIESFNKQAKSYINRGSKITALKEVLESHAQSIQQNVLSRLAAAGVESKSYWVNNKIFVKKATQGLVEFLQAYPEVSEIREEKTLHIIDGLDTADKEPITPLNEWNIVDIDAPLAWAVGYEGQGAVVASIDTGARYNHEALVSNFRSEYGWFDPYNGIENPNDLQGHGTHTIGTIAGSFQIGVAPKAKWVSCKGCSTTSCTEAALVGCGQWVTCPTLWDGSAADCTFAPNVVSNSWGGGQGDPFYNGVIASWQAAGIIPVFAMGNSGPSCGSANSPGDQDGVIAVGATTAAKGCASFSSKGPAAAGGSLNMKPDVCAPGNGIRSATNTGNAAYANLSGTSMACPHVSGLVALMVSAKPTITYDQVLRILQDNSDRDLLDTTVTCDNTAVWPNEAYGYGKVNALKATAAAAALP